MTLHSNRIDLPLARRTACTDGTGPFIANVYYLPNSLQCRSLIIGAEPPKDTPSLFQIANERLNANEPLGGPWHAAAILLTRLCTLEHPDERTPDLAGNRIEIVNAYIAADPGTERFSAPRLGSRSFHGNVKTHGFDREKRGNPLVLPAAEGISPPNEIIAVRSVGSSYFYAALHAEFEQLVGIDPTLYTD